MKKPHLTSLTCSKQNTSRFLTFLWQLSCTFCIVSSAFSIACSFFVSPAQNLMPEENLGRESLEQIVSPENIWCSCVKMPHDSVKGARVTADPSLKVMEAG